MKYLVTVMLVLALLVSPAFALTDKQEADIALSDKLVQSEADNRELTADVEHLSNGQKFYWLVIGMFIHQAVNQSNNDTKGHGHHRK